MTQIALSRIEQDTTIQYRAHIDVAVVSDYADESLSNPQAGSARRLRKASAAAHRASALDAN